MEKFQSVPTLPYHAMRDQIKSGDILLCSGNAFFSNMIQRATNSPWSHVAFVLRLDIIDRIMVLESVESIGVRTVLLSSYVQNYNGTGKGYPGKIALARHQDIQQENMVNLSRSATALLGYPYDTEEIVRIASRIGMHSIGLPESGRDPIPQREFICSEFVYTCFKSIGVDIPYDPLGFIAPADFASCRKIDALCFIHTEDDKTLRAKKQSREYADSVV